MPYHSIKDGALKEYAELKQCKGMSNYNWQTGQKIETPRQCLIKIKNKDYCKTHYKLMHGIPKSSKIIKKRIDWELVARVIAIMMIALGVFLMIRG